ncbi:MAG: hypothetical protein R3D58_18035 [Saprospiraceae bacterium]
MRHPIIAVFVSSIMIPFAQAQPVMDISTELVIGDKMTHAGWIPGAFFDPGPAGADQVWDFGALPGTPFLVSREVLPSAGTQFASQYPDAEYCVRTSAGSGPPSFNYFSATDSSVQNFGLAVPGVFREFNLMPFTRTYPLAFDSTLAGTYSGTRINNSQTAYFKTNYQVKYDAYGKLGAQENAMRIRTVLAEQDSVPLSGGGYRRIYGEQEYYIWYVAGRRGMQFWTSRYTAVQVTFSAAGDTLSTIPLSPVYVVESALSGPVSAPQIKPVMADLFKIRSNPVAEWLIVEAADHTAAKILEAYICDMQGGVLRNLGPASGGNVWEANVGDLPAGNYLLQVIAAGRRQVRIWQKI